MRPMVPIGLLEHRGPVGLGRLSLRNGNGDLVILGLDTK